MTHRSFGGTCKRSFYFAKCNLQLSQDVCSFIRPSPASGIRNSYQVIITDKQHGEGGAGVVTVQEVNFPVEETRVRGKRRHPGQTTEMIYTFTRGENVW